MKQSAADGIVRLHAYSTLLFRGKDRIQMFIIYMVDAKKKNLTHMHSIALF